MSDMKELVLYQKHYDLMLYALPQRLSQRLL